MRSDAIRGETAVGAPSGGGRPDDGPESAPVRKHISARRSSCNELERPVTSVTEAISRATVEIAAEVGARAILTATMSGTTARMVWPDTASRPSPSRPRHRCLAPECAAGPCMVWGALRSAGSLPLRPPMRWWPRWARRPCEAGMVPERDRVVLTAESPFGGEGRTNMLKVHVVGEDGEVRRLAWGNARRRAPLSFQESRNAQRGRHSTALPPAGRRLPRNTDRWPNGVEGGVGTMGRVA